MLCGRTLSVFRWRDNQTKTAATAWGNGGAASTQSIVSGDGYVEFTAAETNKDRVCGLSNGDANQSWTDIDFGLYTRADGKASIVEFGIYYSAINVPIATGDLLRVSIEGGVVKYKKNGTVFHTSGATATYPLRVDTAFYTTASTLSNVVISGNLGSGSAVNINWLVADQLGTPRMVFDKTGALATTKRHDYLPFGEELFTGQGLRTTALGYSGDNIRQQFTSRERDNETGLDYFLARYYSSTQGRFTSPDPLSAPASAHPNIPQSWNLYTYVLNNPLKLVDPDGMMWIYRYLDKEHTKIGIAWIEGDKISKADKAQGYQALNFGGESSRDVTLTNGSVFRLNATSGNPRQLRGPQQGGGNGAYVNSGLVQELGTHEVSRGLLVYRDASALFRIDSVLTIHYSPSSPAFHYSRFTIYYLPADGIQTSFNLPAQRRSAAGHRGPRARA